MVIDWAHSLELWWTFIILVMGWSYIYKETDLFHFVEYSLIGVGTAHATIAGIWYLYAKAYKPMMTGTYALIIGFLLGAMMYTRYSRRYAWLMRYSLGIMTGTYMGLNLRGTLAASITAQIGDTIRPLWGVPIEEGLNHLILLIVAVCVGWYFLFSERLALYPSPYKYVEKIGRAGICTLMGYYLSNNFTSQQVYLFSRVEFVLSEFLGTIRLFLTGG